MLMTVLAGAEAMAAFREVVVTVPLLTVLQAEVTQAVVRLVMVAPECVQSIARVELIIPDEFCANDNVQPKAEIRTSRNARFITSRLRGRKISGRLSNSNPWERQRVDTKVHEGLWYGRNFIGLSVLSFGLASLGAPGVPTPARVMSGTRKWVPPEPQAQGSV
jgi:hypothetical protein